MPSYRAYNKIHRMKKSKKLYKSAWFWYSLLFLIILGALAYFLYYFPAFKIKEINPEGNIRAQSQEIIQIAASILDGKKMFLPQSNILSFPEKDIQQAIASRFAAVKDVRIKRRLPDKIFITISEREEAALWCKSGELESEHQAATTTDAIRDFNLFIQKIDNFEPNFNCFHIDKEGVIFESATSSDFIIRSAPKEIKVGGRILDQFLIEKILEIKNKLVQKLNIGVKEAYVFNQNQINFRTSEGWWAYFNPKKDIDWQITSLGLVLENKVPQSFRKNLVYIDLRFEGISIYPSAPKK